MRIVVDALLGIGDADLAEDVDRPCLRLGLRELLVRAQPFGDLPPDGVDRVERRRRLLEDHRGSGAAQSLQLLLVECRRRLVPVRGRHAPRAVAVSGSRPRIVRAVTVLPLPDSPTIASTSPAAHLERDVAHGADVIAVGREGHVEIADVDREIFEGHQSTSPNSSRATAGWRRRRRPAWSRRRGDGARRRGSPRSLRLSPMRVMPSTTSTIATPGGIAVHQMPLVTSLIRPLQVVAPLRGCGRLDAEAEEAERREGQDRLRGVEGDDQRESCAWSCGARAAS